MYRFSYKHKNSLFWKSLKVKGHNYEAPLNQMVCYLENGGLFAIPSWNEYYLRLGIDWVLFTKENMRKESGVRVD
jgi:hypothetical protein